MSQGSISPWSNRHEPTSFYQDVVLKLDELLTFQPRTDTGWVHDLGDSREKAKAAPSGRPPLCPAAPAKPERRREGRKALLQRLFQGSDCHTGKERSS